MSEDYQIMKLRNFFSRHFSDLVVYCLVPAVSVLIPASFSRKLILRMSAWQWLLSGEAIECHSRAAEYTAIADPQEWMRRWRLVTILEVRDLSLLSWGRRSAVFREISGADDIEQARDRVLVGMHWGPSIAILSLIQSKGQNPLLVYRSVEPSIFRVRPWFYFFLKRSVRYIHKTCGDRAITIKGAGAALSRELPRPGSSVVVLDAPPAPGRSTIDGTVIGRPVKFNAGFPGILDKSGREYHFYAITLDDGDEALRKLELTPARRPESQEQLIRDYCDFLSEHINKDSAQWRIWQVAGQFFQSTEAETEGVEVQG
jgi:hypothetical protein